MGTSWEHRVAARQRSRRALAADEEPRVGRGHCPALSPRVPCPQAGLQANVTALGDELVALRRERAELAGDKVALQGERCPQPGEGTRGVLHLGVTPVSPLSPEEARGLRRRLQEALEQQRELRERRQRCEGRQRELQDTL